MTEAPAARAVLRVLRYLGEQSGTVRASAISRDLGLPRSSVYKLVRALQDEGFVMHFPEERSFALSLRAMTLVADDQTDARLARVTVPLLNRLVRRLDVPVVAHVSVLRSDDVVYRAEVSSSRAPTLVTDIGVHLPAHLTATGRSMLAHLLPEQVRALYPAEQSLIRRTGRGPQSLVALRKLLAEVRERGWAEERGDVASGLGSVAAAVLDHHGHPVASIGVTFRVEAVDRSEWRGLGFEVRSVADAVAMRVRGAI